MVDDERAVREALDRALRLEGFEVALASDGERALQVLGDARPDAIVLDVLMPGLDGLEVCQVLRRMGDRTPVLMLTARDAVSDRVAGLDAGADDYLVKPFAAEELLARLRALLRLADQGIGLTHYEVDAILGLDVTALDRFAGTLDPRLEKASLEDLEDRFGLNEHEPDGGAPYPQDQSRTA